MAWAKKFRPPQRSFKVFSSDVSLHNNTSNCSTNTPVTTVHAYHNNIHKIFKYTTRECNTREKITHLKRIRTPQTHPHYKELPQTTEHPQTTKHPTTTKHIRIQRNMRNDKRTNTVQNNTHSRKVLTQHKNSHTTQVVTLHRNFQTQWKSLKLYKSFLSPQSFQNSTKVLALQKSIHILRT